MTRTAALIFFFLAFATTTKTVMAQNTGGILGPVVNAGQRSFQYRSAFDPNDDSTDEVGFAQRLHYQQSVSGSVMLRLVAQQRKTAASDFDFDFVQGELTYQISPDDKFYQTGLRFDVRIRDQGRANQLGVNWTNQWNLSNDWNIRAILLSAINVTNDTGEGVFLQVRSHAAKLLSSGKSVGVETFNTFGTTTNFGSFNSQSHTIGPFLTVPLAHKFSVFAGALYGVSEAAPDAEVRLWLTKAL